MLEATCLVHGLPRLSHTMCSGTINLNFFGQSAVFAILARQPVFAYRWKVLSHEDIPNLAADDVIINKYV